MKVLVAVGGWLVALFVLLPLYLALSVVEQKSPERRFSKRV